jgi:hypothetical protein
VKLAINQINTQLSKINSFTDGDLDTFINERVKEIEEFIIHPVQVLESFLNFAYEEKDADNSLILYLTTVVYEDFYLYLNCVK